VIFIQILFLACIIVVGSVALNENAYAAVAGGWLA